VTGSQEKQGDGFKAQFVSLASTTADRAKETAQMAASRGGRTLAGKAIAGYIERRLEDVRPDQLQAMLNEGRLLTNQLLGPGQQDFDRVVKMLKRVAGQQTVHEIVEDTINGSEIERIVKESHPEIYEQIMNHPGGGRKWFQDQARAVRKEFHRRC